MLIGFLVPADVGPGVHRQLASWGFDIAPLVPSCFAVATAKDGRFRGGVVAAWIGPTLVLAAFLATPLLSAHDAALILRVTAQKVVFVTIGATFVYQGYQAAKAGTR